MATKGCSKCDYTGFSYGKIPCECSISNETVNKPQETWAEFHGVPEIDTQVKDNDIPDGGNDFSPLGCSIRVGDLLYVNDDGSVTTHPRTAPPIGCVYNINKDNYIKKHVVDVALYGMSGCIVTLKIDNAALNINKGDIVYYKNKLLGTVSSILTQNMVMVEVPLFVADGKKELEYGLIRVDKKDITKVIPVNNRRQYRYEMDF